MRSEQRSLPYSVDAPLLSPHRRESHVGRPERDGAESSSAPRRFHADHATSDGLPVVSRKTASDDTVSITQRPSGSSRFTAAA